LLGKQVSTFVIGKFSEKIVSLHDDFNYETFSFNGVTFVPIHHPSYILVYKRKNILDYIKGIQSLFDHHFQQAPVCVG
jgi:DNA polymerase